MGLFRRNQEPEGFQHGTGHSSLADVIADQSPKYETPDDVTRPRGRAYRLHPTEPPPPEKPRGWIPPLETHCAAPVAAPVDADSEARAEPSDPTPPPPPVRRLWSPVNGSDAPSAS